jgi:membrane-associated protein
MFPVTHLVEHILHVPTWLAVLIVFTVPALEASTFVGVVFPGEIACLLGGVLAFESKVALWIVIVAAIGGAVAGDSVGYFVGRKFGDSLLNRLPSWLVSPRHVEKAKEMVRRYGGRAVFFGRFTAALRALVPGFAGAADIGYRRFVLWNFIGGAVWATSAVVAGYLAGNAWHKVNSLLNVIGYTLAGVVVLAIVAVVLIRRRRHR